MHVALQRARQRRRGRVVVIDGAEAPVPEVGGGVFVRDEEDGQGGGGRGGGGRGGGGGGSEDGVRGGRVVFAGVRGEGFGEGGAAGKERRKGGVSISCRFAERTRRQWQAGKGGGFAV